MEFKLNNTELETLQKHKEAIELIYGEVGAIKYCFGQSGIGVKVEVIFVKYNITKDITDYTSW